MKHPSSYIKEALTPGDTLLSVCCGIGIELRTLGEGTPITAVDIVPEYVKEFKNQIPWADIHVSDALKYLSSLPDDSFDVVSCIDGVEHLTKKRGLKLLGECKRVCRKKALIFTPQGYTKNEPEHTWGIDGGDEHQKHLSGWTAPELRDLGYELWDEGPSTTVLGQDFMEGMYVYNKPQ